MFSMQSVVCQTRNIAEEMLDQICCHGYYLLDHIYFLFFLSCKQRKWTLFTNTQKFQKYLLPMHVFNQTKSISSNKNYGFLISAKLNNMPNQKVKANIQKRKHKMIKCTKSPDQYVDTSNLIAGFSLSERN